MRIREKEFERDIQRALSEKDKVLRLRRLGDTFIRYLNYGHGKYSESAIKNIEKTIIRKYSGNEVPAELHKLFLETARYYSRNERFDDAEAILAEIMDSRNVSIMIQAEYERDLIQLKRKLERGQIDPEIIGDINDIVKQDEDNELETVKTGEFSDFDVFRSYFGDKIPVKDLTEDIFPANMVKPRKTKHRDTQGTTTISGNGAYIEELSANNRLNFLINNFDIEYAASGQGKFTGAIMFVIRDSNLVIVENFWKEGKIGESPVEDYGKATYILPKDQAMDLIELARGEIRSKKDPRIKTVNHVSTQDNTTRYYDNLVDRFNKALEESTMENVEPEVTPSENERPEIDTSKEDAIRIGNEEFLKLLNENLGGLVTPEMMKEFLKNSSYSFNDLYNSRLKNEIYGRLDILEIPEELKETEAQKVFLYIRIAKSMSLINSRVINGEKLTKVLDDSVIEYSKAMEFIEKHKDDGLSYRELKKAIKQYVETEKDPFEPEAEQENEEPQVPDETSVQDNEEVPSNVEEQQEEDILDTLFGRKVKKETKFEIMNLITRYTELLRRNEELDAENQRVEQRLAEKKRQLEIRKQETQDAQEQERLARLATQAAIEQEAIANGEVAEAQKEQERIKQEQSELKDKISKIQDILR